MLLAPLTHNLSFLLHSSVRRVTAQSRTVVINVMSVCCRLADSVILNVIQASEANHTGIEHSKVVQYNRQTQEHVYAYTCVVQNVHNNRLRWSRLMKKGDCGRSWRYLKMMEFVSGGLLLLCNYPFITHILSRSQKTNLSLLVCEVPCSTFLCGSTQLVD